MGDFRNYAACRDVDPELFFPSGNGPLSRLQTQRAKAVCGRCRVTAQCLEWSMSTGQPEGVWGGMEPDERRRLRQRRRRAALADVHPEER